MMNLITLALRMVVQSITLSSKDKEWVDDGQWDFYSGLPNPSYYDDSDDQTEGDEG